MIPLPMNRAPEKPKFGEPCNGCGFCCAAEVCYLGELVFGKQTPAPCPGMQFDGGRFWCGVIRANAGTALGESLAFSLGIGRGCDSDDRASG